MAESLYHPNEPHLPWFHAAGTHASSTDGYMVADMQTQEKVPTSRKRPKYTRSKTGCLTCRMKKIKCGEEKPRCARCTQGQRECTWPDGVPTRKKSSFRKSLDVGAGSSRMSGSSTPPTRGPTPDESPVSNSIELLRPNNTVVSRVYLDSYLPMRQHTDGDASYHYPVESCVIPLPHDLHASGLPNTSFGNNHDAYLRGLQGVHNIQHHHGNSNHTSSQRHFQSPRASSSPNSVPFHNQNQHQYHHYSTMPTLDNFQSFLPPLMHERTVVVASPTVRAAQHYQ